MTVAEVILNLTGVKYDPYLKHQSFDDVIALLMPKIEGYVKLHQKSIPGFDGEDIKQELMIEVWRKLPRVPADIDKVDRRFYGYFETIFSRKIIDLHRSLRTQSSKIPGKYGDYRDAICRSTFVGEFSDNFDQVEITHYSNVVRTLMDE